MEKSKTSSIKILSYNIHKGFSASNLRFTLGAIKKAIQATSADLVFLQEVQGQHKKKASRYKDWPSEAQFEFLADKVWSHYSYGKNAIYDSGHHGNALLSKFPIVGWDNYNVSTNRLEQRGILHTVVNLPLNEIRIHTLCLHFNLLAGARTRQLEELVRIAKSVVPTDEPLIIAGDFNDWGRKASSLICDELKVSEVFRTLNGSYAKTYPAALPVASLDRIYSRGLKPVGAQVLKGSEWRKLSDHTPLLAELEI